MKPGTQVKTENELNTMAATRPRCLVSRDSLTIGGTLLDIVDDG